MVIDINSLQKIYIADSAKGKIIKAIYRILNNKKQGISCLYLNKYHKIKQVKFNGLIVDCIII